MVKRFAVAAGLVLALAACQDDDFNRSSRHLSPIPPATMALMSTKGMSKSDPIVIRSYKKESEMEVWKRGSDGRYALLKTYPICRWSGQLGPKVKEGDRQAPEGFYAVNPAQMNPNSAYFLSFDTGFPNAFDRAHGRTGSALMVHGSCSSRGCFAMTDEAIAEVYAIARESFSGGQRTFQFQSYPFRMTAQNLAQHRYDPHMPFWKNLKEGSDYFETLREEPKVAVCGRRYVFGGTEVAQGDCSPEMPAAVAEKQQRDEQQVAELVSRGVQPVKLVYDDGGGHESFRKALANATTASDGSLVVDARTRNRLGDVSRPESLAMAPREILLDSSGQPKDQPSAALAYASTRQTPAEAVTPAPAQVAAAAPVQAAAPVAAKPKTTVASAAPVTVQPVQATASGEAKPFYQRMFSGIGSVFGSSEPAASAPAAAPAGAGKVQDRRAQATATAAAN
ncbi:MAG TPA: murein L,D-transpeptidase family protein [Microvirga sp.]|jgi:murein L,D-transpeptidase YafK